MKKEETKNPDPSKEEEKPTTDIGTEKQETKKEVNLENKDEADQNEEVSELEKLQNDLAEAKDKYLRLYSEFENFRRRTAKERLDLIKTANQDLMVAILPVLDDFERASTAGEEADTKVLMEGLQLIHQKFAGVLSQKGLKAMDNGVGKDFDAELHEAISQIPAPKKKLKNKIVDVVEKGYLLEDKVIRYAKVVIGT